MSVQFKKSPLLQAVCEFRFEEEQWKGEAVGQFFEKWRDRLPTLLMPDFGQDAIRFFSKDSTRCVAMYPSYLSVSLSAPYTHWNDFKGFIEAVLSDYHQLAPIESFSRVGLRYLNAIKVTPPQPFEDYVALAPRNPEGMEPSEHRKFGFVMEQAVMVYFDLNGELHFRQGSRGNPEEGILLNLDFATYDASLVNFSNVMAWLQVAHDEIETVFLANITPRAREMFEEEL